MTDPADWRPENEPEPEDERRMGDAVIVIVLAFIAAWLIGYGALHLTGYVSETRTQYQGGGADHDALQFPEEFEPTEERDQ